VARGDSRNVKRWEALLVYPTRSDVWQVLRSSRVEANALARAPTGRYDDVGMRRLFASISLLAAACSFPEYTQQLVPEQAEPVETSHGGQPNGGETAADCKSNADCSTGVCNSGACVAPSCSDGVRNRSESDIDCGGNDGCVACQVGRLCSGVADCDGGDCSGGRCQAPSCSDGLENQDESDVDCGGTSCDRCTTKQHCRSSADCDHAQCSQGRCQAAACADGVKNGDETAADCGGSCVPCDDFSSCKVAEDCQSLVCSPYAGICLAPTCDDGVLNADESDLDCGKSCAKKCGLTRDCNVALDCESGACGDGRCVPASFTNQALPTNGWLATASHTFSPDTTPQKAIDGNGGTHWTNGTGQLPGMWFQVDMLEPTPFFRVDMVCTSNDDYPRSLRVLVSDDGQSFTPITGAIAGEPTMHLDFGKARIARYIRFEQQQDGANVWWRIDELQVLK
jgi:hypothetical protein